MKPTERRYDIDWLRVIAIGLLIMYHIGFVFLPWGVFIGFIQNEDSLESLWIPMSMVNIWRIPLLFFVSGMGVCFAIRRRNWKQLIMERTRRILLPFLFGILCVVPLHLFIWQKYYSQDITYSVQPSHLWFLANIFIYVVLLSPLFFFLRRNGNGRIYRGLTRIYSSPLGLLLTTIVFLLEAMLVNPESYETYSMTLHGFLLGLLAFLFGFIFVYTDEAFWQNVKKWRWVLLTAAIALFLVRHFVFQLQAPGYYKAIESCMWIYAVFGFGYTYLNHSSRSLAYLSSAAYPVYILHMIFLYTGSSLIAGLALSPCYKFILLLIFTITACFVAYELIIKRVGFLRPLFGLKRSMTALE
ncbi:MAG: acyltransferase family protein [Bacteroidota bacterium]